MKARAGDDTVAESGWGPCQPQHMATHLGVRATEQWASIRPALPGQWEGRHGRGNVTQVPRACCSWSSASALAPVSRTMFLPADLISCSLSMLPEP